MATTSTRLPGVNAEGLPLADDLLVGAGEIARFIYGDDSEPNRRRVYHAASKREFPTFKLNGAVSARRSTILRFIESREQAA
jgi:hypothetical protein